MLILQILLLSRQKFHQVISQVTSRWHYITILNTCSNGKIQEKMILQNILASKNNSTKHHLSVVSK